MSNPNDKLHQQALDALADRKPTKAEQEALDGAQNYNQRRKEATARFGEVASQIWEKLEAGEAVGGVNTKEAWCGVVGIKIRWAQKAINRHRGVLSTPSAEPGLHPLGASIDSLDYDSEKASIELEVSGWRDMPDRRSYSVLGDLTIMIMAQDVPIKMEMPCPLCDHDRMTVREDGTYGDHVKDAGKLRADSYCPMSGQPVRGNIAERYLVALLYRKMEKTLRHMRLWHDSLKLEFDAAVKDAKEAHRITADARSRGARKAAETRKANVIQRPIRPASVPVPAPVETECLPEHA